MSEQSILMRLKYFIDYKVMQISADRLYIVTTID